LLHRSRLFIALRATLPLAATVLATAVEMLILWAWLIVLWARLVVLWPGLIVLRTRLIILWPWLIVLRALWLPALLASFMLTTALGARCVITLVGHNLRTNGDHQQTYTCQTPDALHAIPHCGLGPVHETGKAGPGSRTGYQQAKEKG
jgi:hypothetical protein